MPQYHSDIGNPERYVLLKDFEGSFHPTTSDGNADADELIRLLNGVYIYGHEILLRFCGISYDFAYGFYTNRDVWWSSSAASSLRGFCAKKETYKWLIESAKAWVPATFTLEERKTYIEKNNKALTPEVLKTYERLVKIDSAAWMERDYHERIQNATGYELLEAALRYAGGWSKINVAKIKRWDRQMGLPILKDERRIMAELFERHGFKRFKASEEPPEMHFILDRLAMVRLLATDRNLKERQYEIRLRSACGKRRYKPTAVFLCVLKKYGKLQFTAEESRNQLFGSRCRPTLEHWKVYLEHFTVMRVLAHPKKKGVVDVERFFLK